MRKDCPLDALILDFGGVVAEEGFAAGLKALARGAGRDEHEVWQAGLAAVWDSGYVTGKADEAAFWKLFKERTGVEGDENAWRAEIFRLFAVRPFMRELAERFRTMGVATAILSDQTDWLARLDAEQGFFKHFDKVYNSYDHGATKLEPGFFLMALKDLGCAPGRALFVDDNPGNVERARALGMHAIHYTGREAFERDLALVCPAALDG